MITIKRVTEEDLATLWQICYIESDPEWKKWDGPYFNDYKPLTWEEFKQKQAAWFLRSDVYGIYVNEVIIGIVSRHWENEKTRWLEVGIVIYEPHNWKNGYGTRALTQWITQTFADFPQIQHVGLTTWSGNQRMMKTAKKMGLMQEACIRKVRYWRGNYYDSVKYGVLRDEWNELYNK